ncbi:MAG TPA: hypothetical protein DCR24_14840 [Bacillus bacterium]|nr:hypothetical protein [Bacillus sp. (in: firmicutes)]
MNVAVVFDMRIADFERFIEPVILERGHKLYKSGAVIDLNQADGKRVVALVSGSQIYHVEISLEGDSTIKQSSCSCPYDWSEVCKHQAAVFFALRENDQPALKDEKPSAPENKLKKSLLQESKEDLAAIIMQFAESHEEIEKQLLLRYASPEEEIATAKALIREYIKGAKSSGFIYWNRMSEAMQGACLVLENAEKKIRRGRYVDAVKLALEIMPPVVAMTQYSDDSGGEITDVTIGTMRAINEAIKRGIDQISPEEQKEIFKAVMKEAKNKRYDGWEDWRFDLLGAIVPFARESKLRDLLQKELDLLLKKLPEDSWSRKYTESRIKEVQLQLLEFSGADENEIDAFIEESLEHSAFREKAILRAVERSEYGQAEILCLQGEKADQSYAGLIHKWKDYRFQIYEKLGDIERQQSMAYELVTAYSEYKDYARLKALFSDGEWPELLENLLNFYEDKRYQPDLYVTILQEEKMDERLLAYIKRNHARIIDLYPYLIENHLSEVNRLFVETIEDEAERASDRKKYKKVCKTIKKYKEACGEVNSRKLIENLISKYPRRPAFLDELKRLK